MYDLQLDVRAAVLQQLLCHGAAQTHYLQLHLGPIRGLHTALVCAGSRSRSTYLEGAGHLGGVYQVNTYTRY